MRGTDELIEELKQEVQQGAWVATLVVGFQNHTEFISTTIDDKPLERLNAMVKAGGEPIGIFIASRVPGIESASGLKFTIRPLREHAGEPWAKDYLLALVDVLSQTFADETGTEKVEPEIVYPDTIQ